MKKEPEQEQQLDLGLQEPFSNKLVSTRYRIELFFVKLRANSILRNPLVWIIPILTLTLILIQYYYFHNYYSQLPNEIPIFNITNNLDYKIANKEVLIWIMGISLFLSIASIIAASRKFYQSRQITIITIINLLVAIFLITFAYIKIFSIYIL